MEKLAVEIKRINKIYGDKRVLSDVSFSVQPGTIHGFIGPNGAGKTTMLSIMVRLVIPNSGEVKIEGKSVATNPSFNENVGFIPAEPQFPNLSVEGYALDCGYLRGIPRKVVLKKLANSPLAQFRYQSCHSLSTGWKKFLQIFVLFYKPKIIFCDEPFNGLDPSFRKDLFDNILKMRREGRTVIISSHILSDLQKLVDDFTMIKRGKIVYSGTKTDDLEKIYEDYFVDKSQKIFDL